MYVLIEQRPNGSHTLLHASTRYADCELARDGYMTQWWEPEGYERFTISRQLGNGSAQDMVGCKKGNATVLYYIVRVGESF